MVVFTMNISMYFYFLIVCVFADSLRGQKGATVPFESELQAAVSLLIWVVQTELGSSVREAITLNC